MSKSKVVANCIITRLRYFAFLTRVCLIKHVVSGKFSRGAQISIYTPRIILLNRNVNNLDITTEICSNGELTAKMIM